MARGYSPFKEEMKIQKRLAYQKAKREKVEADRRAGKRNGPTHAVGLDPSDRYWGRY